MTPNMKSMGFVLSGIAGLGLMLGGALLSLRAAAPTTSHRVLAPPGPWVFAAGEPGSLVLRFTPAADAPRAEFTLDEHPLNTKAALARHTGLRTLDFAPLRPGYHVLEIALTRLGRTPETTSVGLVAGDFPPARTVNPCGAQLQIRAEPLESLLAAIIGRKTVAAARDTRYFSASTEVIDSKTRLVSAGILFEVAVADERNQLAFQGKLRLRSEGRNKLAVSLDRVERVSFTGATRRDANSTGAVVGAVIGGAALGPIGLLGALFGASAANNRVSREARRSVDRGMRGALKSISPTALFPDNAMLAPNEPRSLVSIEFCAPLDIDSSGVVARLSITPDLASPPPQWRMDGVMDLSVALPPPDPAPEFDILVDLSIDPLNSVLDTWTRNGFLLELLGVDALLEEANEKLSEYTELRVSGVEPRLPPLLVPQQDQGEDPGYAIGLGGLDFSVKNLRSGQVHSILAGAQGRTFLRFDPGSEAIKLGAAVDVLHFACEEMTTTMSSALTPCFSGALDLDEVAEEWTARLHPDLDHLPSLQLDRLLRRHTQGLRDGGLGVGEVVIDTSPSQPGLLRLRANARW